MAIRDPDSTHPVPEEWRSALTAIVHGFVEGDFGLKQVGPPVAPIDKATKKQIREYIADYGETLVDLPDEVWEYAEAAWLGDDRWQVLVDLWTEGEGRSDLVLDAVVVDDGHLQKITVHLVYVP